jgi:photosystem I subunit 3
MKRWFSIILTATIFASTPLASVADVSGLVPCKESAVFKRRLEGSVKKLKSRLDNYEPGTPAYLALEQQIEKTKTRFKTYGDQGLLCGAD